MGARPRLTADARESGKLRDSAWNRWRRETSNLCSRSKPPNHQPGAKPPKVGGLGVNPYPALGPFVFWRSRGVAPGANADHQTIKRSCNCTQPKADAEALLKA
jgi:hypothetical protein